MTTEAAITTWLASQKDAMLLEIAAMVNTDGGSYDKDGVDRTGAQVQRFLRLARHRDRGAAAARPWRLHPRHRRGWPRARHGQPAQPTSC